MEAVWNISALPMVSWEHNAAAEFELVPGEASGIVTF